jgi:hypothetical protein
MISTSHSSLYTHWNKTGRNIQVFWTCTLT